MVKYNRDVEILEVELIDEVLGGGADFQLVVHNDEVNTFDWVIQCLIEVCGHTPEQAEQCSLIIHFKGRYGVKRGSRDGLKPMRNSLVERGLSVTIEKIEE